MRTFFLITYHLFGSWNSIGYRLASKIDGWVPGPARMPISDSTQILIDGPGGSGLTSFVQYIEKWNPDFCLAHHNHSGYLYRLAKKRDIPAICITRELSASVRSLKSRYPASNKLIVPHLRFFSVLACANLSNAFFTSLDEIVYDPRNVVKQINQRFNLNLNPGDGIMPHERPMHPDLIDSYSFAKAN